MFLIENKKNIFIKLTLLLIILIFSIYKFFILKDGSEEFNSLETIVNISSENIEEKEIIQKIKVYIAGEVGNPGVYELNENSRIEDVISLAGGLTQEANIKNINLAFILEDGQKIYIPNINENDILDYSAQETPESSKININKASISELQNLPRCWAISCRKNFKLQKRKWKI